MSFELGACGEVSACRMVVPEKPIFGHVPGYLRSQDAPKPGGLLGCLGMPIILLLLLHFLTFNHLANPYLPWQC